jgi:drug/metabolite transporter (DMT)-like permease
VAASDCWELPFVALAAIWGSSFLFIKLIGERWPPLWVTFGRVTLGALTLVTICALRRERLRFDRVLWGRLAVVALLFNVIPFALFAYGERHVSSIVAGLWNATTPLWTLVFVLSLRSEAPPTRQQVLGLGVGFVGVLLILLPWRSLSAGQLGGEAACAGAAACYGLAFVFSRRYLTGRREGAVALSAGQLVCATAMTAVLMPFAGTPSWSLGAARIGGILSLGILGSGIAYVLNFEVVRRAGATVASTVTYVVPLFSTALGIIVLGEPLTWNEPVGGAVLLLGVAAAQQVPITSRVIDAAQPS